MFEQDTESKNVSSGFSVFKKSQPKKVKFERFPVPEKNSQTVKQKLPYKKTDDKLRDFGTFSDIEHSSYSLHPTARRSQLPTVLSSQPLVVLPNRQPFRRSQPTAAFA